MPSPWIDTPNRLLHGQTTVVRSKARELLDGQQRCTEGSNQVTRCNALRARSERGRLIGNCKIDLATEPRASECETSGPHIADRDQGEPPRDLLDPLLSRGMPRRPRY